MKKFILFAFTISFATWAFSQAVQKSLAPGYTAGKAVKSTAVLAPDFTITDTDGNVLNLYQTLDQGKTVFLDFFYTTCGYCIAYAPIIEQAYQNHGAGQGDIIFWGLDYGDDNAEVIAYKNANNITNPCASGTQGGGNQATAAYQSAFNFIGWPTYTIICPDKTVQWDVNYPPSVAGFNQYFSTCGAMGIEPSEPSSGKTQIVKMYPIPAGNKMTLDAEVSKASQLKVEVYNILGVKTTATSYEIYAQGRYELELDLAGLRGGQYFLKLFQDDQLKGIYKFTRTN